MKKVSLLATFLMAVAIRSQEDEVLSGEESSLVCQDATSEEAFEIDVMDVQEPSAQAKETKGCDWLLQDQERKVRYCLKNEVQFICPKACDACSVKNESTLKLISESTSVSRETYNAICPQPHDNFYCPSEYEPVSCGEHYCIYDNMCKAQQASFTYSACGVLAPPTPAPTTHLMCPDHHGGGYCPDVFDPVLCGYGPLSCWYQNMCHALQSHFNAYDCGPATPPTPEPTPSPHDICPVPQHACSMPFDPVYCGPKHCWYSSLCYAQQAGFTANQCGLDEYHHPTPHPTPHPTTPHPPIPHPTPHPTSGHDICPVPNMHNNCDHSRHDVYCGPHKCWYLNVCWAQSASFSAHDCGIYHPTPTPPTPQPTFADCPVAQLPGLCNQDHDPVVCGSDHCKYLNICHASLANFDPHVCTKVPQPQHCPHPQITGECPQIHNPVMCGDCEYLNLCFAQKAFFDPNHCHASPPEGPVHTSAPTSSPSTCEDTDLTFKIDQTEDTYPHYHKRQTCYWLAEMRRRQDKYCDRSYVKHACPFTCCVCKKGRPFCKQTESPTASPTYYGKGKGKGSRKT